MCFFSLVSHSFYECPQRCDQTSAAHCRQLRPRGLPHRHHNQRFARRDMHWRYRPPALAFLLRIDRKNLHFVPSTSGSALAAPPPLLSATSIQIPNLCLSTYYGWEIELFFKALKQNLKVKSFVGTSENALRIQIWTALIAMLLLKWMHYLSKAKWSLSNLASMLRLNLFTYRDLTQWLHEPFLTEPIVPQPEQLQLAI
jgi:hypothetical protein